MRAAKFAFCAKCNLERPTYKDYVYRKDGKKASNYKVTVCVVCRERVLVANKYGAIRTKSNITDRTFDSRKEARREPALVAMENAGIIRGLRYQVPYRLDVYGTQIVDELLAAIDRLTQNTSSEIVGLAVSVRRSRQRIANYIADFVYADNSGDDVVEDVKGRATAAYRLKKKLMVACHNVEIVEPGDKGVEQKARGAGVHGAHTGSRFKGGR